jgi:hypothetical protein
VRYGHQPKSCSAISTHSDFRSQQHLRCREKHPFRPSYFLPWTGTWTPLLLPTPSASGERIAASASLVVLSPNGQIRVPAKQNLTQLFDSGATSPNLECDFQLSSGFQLIASGASEDFDSSTSIAFENQNTYIVGSKPICRRNRWTPACSSTLSVLRLPGRAPSAHLSGPGCQRNGAGSVAFNKSQSFLVESGDPVWQNKFASPRYCA